ncbi:MAG: hypothetical protein QM784_36980 [Polyangiaceae bacterium]
MRAGFFAMFDALGFKGIWDRAARADPPWNVLDKLEKLVAAAADVQGAIEDAHATLVQKGELRRTEVKTLLLSDTIVVAATDESPDGLANSASSWASMLSVGSLVSGILSHAANAPEPRLAYRGCISYGKFEIRSNFVMGPAVDEAATLVDSAQAALVWLTPSAKRVMDGIRLRQPCNLVRPWRVPLKGGHHYETYVISPYVGVAEDSWSSLREALLETFSSNAIDVRIKAQHTDEFLQHELRRRQNARAEMEVPT